MNKILVLLLLLSPHYLFSQNVKIERTIEWQNRSSVNNSKNTDELLYFHNAIIDVNNLPIYAESINLLNYGINSNNVIVKITAQTFENTKINDKQSFSSKIELKSSVFYGRDIPYLTISFSPFIEELGQTKKLTSFTIEITNLPPKLHTSSNSYASNSVLNSGKWVKIGIPEQGVYKITHSELEALGFSSPSSVRVFGNDAGMLSHNNNQTVPDDLVENSIFKGSDYILFYAKEAETWTYNSDNSFFERTKNIYCDTAYYFLTDKNTGFSNSINTLIQSTQTPSATISKYNYYDIYENDLINIQHSGRTWLGESFIYDQQKTISFDIPNIKSGETGQIQLSIAARSTSNSSFVYSFAGQSITVPFSAVSGIHYRIYADYNINKYDFTQSSGALNVDLSYNKPTSSANAWIDKIIVNAIANLSYENQIGFRSVENIGSGKISKFQLSGATSNIQIWEITNPTNPQKINYSLSGSNATFVLETKIIREFVAFDPIDCLTPVFEGQNLGDVVNQNLHNISSATDMIIITPPIFESQAQEFASIHRNHDNLNVVVVTTNEVYNEFGSGMAGAPQIRNYIKMVYEKTNHNLNYVLLFGDGTYNNFGITTEYNPNYIPTFQTENSFNVNAISATTDDFYALLDEDEGEYIGKLDLAVGRMPIKNIDEADAMLAKIQIYYNSQSYGDWRNIVTLVADDNDNDGNFVGDAEKVANKINNNMQFINIKKIYIDAYQQQSTANGEEYPDAVVDLNNRINNGSLIVDYIGHGSEEALTAERLVTRQTINSWNNFEKLSLFITGTCEFSRFDDASLDKDKTSAGEMVILNPDGGAIVMLTTTRVSFSGSNLTLNNNFFDYLFSIENDKYLTIGDAFYKAKNETGDDITNTYNTLVFVLLGDPAIRLGYAKNKVQTSTVNGIAIENFEDTLQALQKVVITGYVSDIQDDILSDFDGELTLSFFDKRKDLITLNNDGYGAYPYWYQFNRLFRGRASVNNGNFSIRFIIPKDIYYNFGKAKFSYYANNTEKQAAGYYNDIILGGIDSDADEDNIGPEIRLFMNDSNFVNGGMTDPNPSIYAILSDENGINTSSASIGHDISATLDNNPNKTYSLNEYYQSDVDNYKKGTVNYGLFKLSAGTHEVSLKVWDTYNNSSEKSITFVVTEDNNIIIKHLLNYPNPFTTSTNFYFEHNKPGIYLDVLLQIFTVSGKLVRTIHQPMTTEGYRSEPIFWNGLDDFDSQIGKGVYIYRIKIRTPDGKIVDKYEKLLILK